MVCDWDTHSSTSPPQYDPEYVKSDTVIRLCRRHIVTVETYNTSPLSVWLKGPIANVWE